MQPKREPRVVTDESVAVIYKTAGHVHRLSATMRNISRSGVFFYTDFRAELGSRIQLMLTFPCEVTYGDPVRACCIGRVVRVEVHGPKNRIGVAVQIESYEAVVMAS